MEKQQGDNTPHTTHHTTHTHHTHFDSHLGRMFCHVLHAFAFAAHPLLCLCLIVCAQVVNALAAPALSSILSLSLSLCLPHT